MAHSRNSSNPHTPLATTFSGSYNHSPITPNSSSSPTLRRHSSSRSRRSSSGYSPRLTRPNSGSFGGTAEGLEEADAGRGTLADELGGWDENDEDEFDEEEEEEDEDEDDEDEEDEDSDEEPEKSESRERDSGIDVASPPVNGKRKTPGLGIDSKSEEEEEEENAEDNDVDAEEMRLVAANLEARLAAIESLAKRGTGDRERDSQGDGDVIIRVTERLKDLGLQSGIETGVTRLVTAHTAISSHVANQTRHLQHMTTTLLSPFNNRPLSDELIDDVLPVITSTLAFLPSMVPDPAPAEALHNLTLKTNSLITALATITDSVNIVNGTPAVTAARRMRAVREVLSELRTDGANRDEGVRYIEQGCWNQRLGNRECASVCVEVMDGFEETCDRWREWLISRGGGDAVVAA